MSLHRMCKDCWVKNFKRGWQGAQNPDNPQRCSYCGKQSADWLLLNDNRTNMAGQGRCDTEQRHIEELTPGPDVFVYLHTLTVQGCGPFPLAALAMQRAHPRALEDLQVILSTQSSPLILEPHTVQLQVWNMKPIHAASPVWEQSGWKVLRFELVQVIEGRKVA